jgi:hypothetical protein
MTRFSKTLNKLFLMGALSGILGFGIITLSSVVKAQRPIFILDLACVDSRRGNDFGVRRSDIVIDREIYTSVMDAEWDSQMTCRLPENAVGLYLEYGMADRDSKHPPMNLKVYLDGNELASRTVSPGEHDILMLDIQGGRSLTLEADCARATNCTRWTRLYFFKADVIPQ